MNIKNKLGLWFLNLKSIDFFVFISYVFISIILTYPMIFRLNAFPYTGAESIPPGSDIFIYLWDMWWFKNAITNFINPFWTDYIFYPQGVSLLFSLGNIIWAIIAIPLQSFLSLIAIYNLSFIFSLIFSGMGAFWLIRYVTNSDWGGFIGGVIYAFAPYHFAHIGHMTVFSVQWIPFFILFFLKMFDEKKWRNAIFAGIFLAAICYSDLNYAAFIALFIVLYLIYKLRYERYLLFSKSYLKQFIVMVFSFSILGGLYVLALLRSVFSGQVNISHPIQSSVNQSADLLSFFVPSFMHPIFGSIVRPFYDHITTFNGSSLGGYIEVTAYVGFITIFLVILALRNLELSRLRFWIFITIIFFLLTLGPVLKVHGLVQIPSAWMHLDKIAYQIEPNLDPLALEMMKKSIGIPLPYLILHFMPLFSGSESAGRLDIMFVLAWSILCAFGVRSLIEKIRKRNLLTTKGLHVAFVFLVIFILFEYAPIPIRMMECPVSIFYKELAKDNDDYAIMDLPILNNELDTDPHARSNRMLFHGFNNTSSKRALYYQTVHQKKILNGITVRLQKNIRDFIDNTDVVRLLAFPEQINKETVIVDINPLQINKIKYIVLHRDYLTENEFSKLTFFLETKFEKVYNDKEIVAYQTYH